MLLTLTVIDPASGGPACDLDVQVPPGATLGDVRRDLLAAVGRSEGALHCATRPLTDQAPLGRAPLLSGAVITVGDSGAPPADGVLELHVTAGVDAGSVHCLPPGEHVVGRGVEAHVRLRDPTLSRAHCLIHVAAEGTYVTDLGSANGTYVDGTTVAATEPPRPLQPGQVLRVGDSCLALAVPAARSAPTRVDRDGHPLVPRPPRLAGVPGREQRRLPTPPIARDPARVPLVAVAVPALMGLGLVVLTRNATYLLFLLFSPVTALASWAGDRLDRRRSLRQDRARYDEQCARLRHDVGELLTRQRLQRHERYPSLAHLATRARAPETGVWERGPDDPDFLVVRLGLGTLAAPVDLLGVDGHRVESSPIVAQPVLHDVPVTLAVGDLAPIGIAGPLAVTRPLVCSLVVQLACLHGPSVLRLAVRSTGPAEAWAWQRWLPHMDRESARPERWVDELDRRLAIGAAGCAAWPRHVLVLEGSDALPAAEAAQRLLTEGAAVGLYVVVVERSVRQLPAACRCVVEVSGPGPARLIVRRSGESDVAGVRPDGASRGLAEAMSRALAPLREVTAAAGAGSEVPQDVRLSGLLGPQAYDGRLLAEGWSRSAALTAVPIGAGPGGAPVVVDLVADGPHVLLAGTTGSGKSELLQSLLAALAVGHRPDELGFLLVDFKGGAAFQQCVDLPHTLGLVTDLDAQLAQRLLRSLRGLLTARERELAAAGVADMEQYVRRAPRSSMPRIVLVIDEFATLADELPDVVGELVSVARRGRSLGLHLVLATQRPSGAVSGDIRANMGLRLCLRVAEAAESVDVIDTPAAASVSSAQPGRGYLRRCGGALEAVQAARVNCRTPTSGDAVHVRPAWRDSPERLTGGERASDLARLVASTRAAAETLTLTPVRSPWLPPLPDHVGWEDLDSEPDCPPTPAGWVAVGLLDRPERGDRSAYRLPARGEANVLVVGTSRSGRSQTLLTLAGRFSRCSPPGALHLYALDGNSRTLRPLADLAQCGCVAAPEDPAFAAQVLRRLVGELERREREPSDGAHRPALLLLIDDWTSWQPLLERVDGGAPVDQVLRLTRSGTAVGICVALSAEREVLASRLADGFHHRVVLRLADRGDYALAGVATGAVPGRFPPGRGVLAGSGLEVQIAATTPDQVLRGGSAWPELEQRPEEMPGQMPGQMPGDVATTAPAPLRLRPVPLRVASSDLPHGGAVTADRLALGLGGDDATPVAFDLREGRALLVLGPPRSGRTTVLRLAASAFVSGHRPVAVLGPRRSSWAPQPGVFLLDHRTPDALHDHLTSVADPVILVDDAEALHDSPVDDLLAHTLGPDGPDGVTMLVCTTADDLAARFRGFAVEARRQRCGLLLGATGPVEGELLGVRLPRQGPGPPGRGLLVVHGRSTPVQVATPRH
ncbi:MAG: segregation ATPase FtsK/SpoIIIE, family [Actinomycetota bacterium]|nr:segregation ATPase FtsK/SpoIIIE, family [Actinomycetota bacterium]